ncbi:hypothetical protein IAI10_00515 [Clostridium sp. 19966]|nr:hypothetical protein [Clostridium sp. 19966]
MYLEHSELYLNFCKIGAGDNYCGAAFIAKWYERNIRIFGNIQNITENNDRIFVMFGAGHIKILSDFVNEYSQMELVDTNKYI